MLGVGLKFFARGQSGLGVFGFGCGLCVLGLRRLLLKLSCSCTNHMRTQQEIYCSRPGASADKKPAPETLKS